MGKGCRIIAILLSVCFFALSPAVTVHAETIGGGAGQMTPGEIWNQTKNAIAFAGTQLGAVFSGTAQDLVLNQAAFDAWMKDRYVNGYDGTPWNAADYYTKECIRNPDGTLTLSDRFVDDAVAWMKEVIDTNCGYYLVKTVAVNNISPALFKNRESYNLFLGLVDSYEVATYSLNSSYTFFSYGILNDCQFVFHDETQLFVDIYKDWKKYSYDFIQKNEDGTEKNMGVRSLSYVAYFGSNQFQGLVTQNGSYVKVFKTVDAAKEDSIGYQPYYCTQKFQEYNEGDDNSITVDEKTFNSSNWVTNNSNIYNDTSQTIINNNTDNTSGMSQSEIMELVDRLLEEFKKDNSGSDDSGGSGGGSDGGSDSGGGSSGNGIGAIIEGLGKLLDFLLAAIGKLIGLVSEFLTKALGLLDGLAGLTGPFAALLADLMPFVPEELWDVIIAGITLSVIVMIIKAFKN